MSGWLKLPLFRHQKRVLSEPIQRQTQMKKAFGEDGMDRILALRTAEQEKAYRAQTDAKHTLKARLDALARLRTAEGYMAEVRAITQNMPMTPSVIEEMRDDARY